MNDAELRLQVTIDDKNAANNVKSLEKSAKSLGDAFKNAGKKLTIGLTLPIVAFGAVAIKNASDLNETMSKIDVAFGKSADEVKKWGKTTLKQYGIAEGTALDMAAMFGDMATGMGFSQEKASDLSTSMVGLAGDMASFKNISIDIAQTALASIFTGETESLKKMGIVMTEANLKQYALSKGMNVNMQDMTQAEKVQLRYNFVMEMSKNSLGDFERTSDSTANQMRIAKETFKEVSAELGENLLPIVNKVLGKVIEFLNWFGQLDEKTQNTILTIAAFAAALGPVLTVVGTMIKTFGLLSGSIGTLTAVASPLAIVLAALAAITAISVSIAIIVDGLKELREANALVSNMQKSEAEGVKRTVNAILAGDKGAASKETGIKEYQKQLTASANKVGELQTKINNIKWWDVLGQITKKDLQEQLNTERAYAETRISAITDLGGTPIHPFAKGSNYIENDGLAYLHKGEAVIPQKYNPYAEGKTYNANSSAINNNFEIGSLNVRNDNDINLIAEQLYYLQKKEVV